MAGMSLSYVKCVRSALVVICDVCRVIFRRLSYMCCQLSAGVNGLLGLCLPA